MVSDISIEAVQTKSLSRGTMFGDIEMLDAVAERYTTSVGGEQHRLLFFRPTGAGFHAVLQNIPPIRLSFVVQHEDLIHFNDALFHFGQILTERQPVFLVVQALQRGASGSVESVTTAFALITAKTVVFTVASSP